MSELTGDANDASSGLVAALAAVSDAKRREDAVSALIAHLKATETPAAVALLRGFSQSVRLFEDDAPLRRPYWQQQYEEGRTDPRTLDFKVLLEAAQSPAASVLVRAHIGDLTYSYRTNQTEVGSISADAYLQLARDPNLDRVEQYVLAARAFNVGRRLDDTSTQDATRTRLLEIVDESLAATTAENSEGGTILRTLEYLVFCGGSKSEADARVRAALPLFEGDWHLRRELALFLATLQESKDDADYIVAEHLRGLIAQADSRDGFLKEALLRQVLATARAQGLRDVAGEASSALAQIRPEDYDFKTSEFSWKLDEETRGQVERFLGLLGTSPPEQAWAIWASKAPEFLPSSERPPYEFQIVDQIATITEVNRAGHVSFQANSDDDIVRYRHHEEDRRLYEYQFQLVIGPGLLVLLNRPECVAALRDRCTRSPLFTTIGAERVSNAFDAFLGGDVDPTGVVLPTIEAAIRTFAIEAHVTIYNPAGAANVFKTLGGLIRDLTPALGNGARFGRFWDFALTDQLGFNIRNEYLHGFLERLTHLDVVVILQVAAQLLFLFTFDPIDPGSPAAGDMSQSG
ncbi:hypothetical protein ITJ66_12395 [Plantibacter sp. VKM Ac-2885]|uniref:hypothetical protein n=1 Tax=Plantibacter sp. VKM Ac-2885 TaxID=2783828 RepID=UPI00188C4BB3|nr:hypothetical protein [Plantibacter sp. VKM Ac-2885]MBF4513281.1 hypothetical protein [Plantibacter sp. VKM Ac-2885]